MDIRGFKGLVDPEGVRSGSVCERLLKGFLTHTYTHTYTLVILSHSLWISPFILDNTLCVNVCASMCVMSEWARSIRSPGRCSNLSRSAGDTQHQRTARNQLALSQAT